VRPILDLKLAKDIERMKIISEKTFELVQHYGGSWSGEHGDGLVRSYMNERFFGERLYSVFREIKRLFDPEGLMNPGKIVDAPPMDESLRFGPAYHVPGFNTFYHYREDGGFDRAVEMCTGVGACRKTLGGTMCPSYIATRDEDHSTRGRANALRLAMSGQMGPGAMAGDALHEVFDLCLSCKGCKAECPSNVDVAKLKGELLAYRHGEKGATLEEYFFGYSPDMARLISGSLGGATAKFVNASNRNRWIRAGVEGVLGIDRRRPLPAFAEESFPAWFDRRERERAAASGGDNELRVIRAMIPQATTESSAHTEPEGHGPDRTVVLFDDTFINYHEPHIGRAAVRMLEALGYEVKLARAGCCTRPLISKGFLEQARERGARTLRRLKAYTDRGWPVLVCEPSCLSALTDDLPDLVHDVAMAKQVAERTMMIDVFLEREIAAGRIDAECLEALKGGETKSKYLIHGHCHQKALYGTASMMALLGECAGAEVNEIPSGCCGMAGSFGYEKDHYELSLQIGEDRLLPAVRKMDAETQLIACGFSCRHQLKDTVGAQARHFVEVFADLVEGRTSG
jgi:Fe-S oxidoreductase